MHREFIANDALCLFVAVLIRSVGLGSMLGCAPSSHADHFLNRPGWKLTFQDEFESGVFNTAKWSAQDAPNYANEELQYYTPENAFVTNGNLVLLSENEGVWDGVKWWPYKSGKVVTAHKFDQQYGRFEVRADLPTSKGMWPAHWMLGYNGWPPEIDFMELIGSVPWRVTVGYHWGPAPPPPLYPWDVGQTANRDIWAGDWTLDYHTFACEWDWWGIKFFIDDAEVFANYYNVPHEPMYLILNTAVGGQWPGAPDWSTQWPQEHLIDYARVYERYDGSSILNGGFEEGEEGTFANWNTLDDGNVISDSEATNALGGARAVQMFGRFDGETNKSYLYQSLPAAPGQIWDASIHAAHRPGDGLQGGNIARLKLEFLDGFGVFNAQHTRSLVTSNTAPGYAEYALRYKAPAWTTHARLTVEFEQHDNQPGAVNLDDAGFFKLTTDTARNLRNGDFEDDEQGAPLSWMRYGSVSNVFVTDGVGEPHEGEGLLRMEAPVSAPTNACGVYQDLPARPAESWTASVWARNRPGTPLQGTDRVILKLEFLNAADTRVGMFTQTLVTAASSTDYSNHLLVASAPVGSAYARMVLECVTDGGGGAADLDLASLLTTSDNESLLNGDFEQYDGTNFPGWTTYGESGNNNVRLDDTASNAHGGTNAVRVFGSSNVGMPESGIYQDMNAGPGEVWEASIWAKNRPSEPLQQSNEAYLKIEFRDAGGGLLDSEVATAVQVGDPTVYKQIVLRRGAPANTAKVRMVMAFVQSPFNALGAVDFDDAQLRRITVNDPRELLNAGFEDSEGTAIVNWQEFPTSTFNVRRDPSNSYAEAGTAAVQMFGQFSGGFNSSGLYQDLPAEAGEVWQAEVSARNRPNDTVQSPNQAKLKLEFISSGGGVLRMDQAVIVSPSTPTSYQRFQLRGEAPADTTRARLVLIYNQDANANGSANLDQARLAPVTAADNPELLNGSFEFAADGDFANWKRSGSGAIPDPVSAHAHAGTSALQLFGVSTAAVSHIRLSQAIPAVEGQLWQASLWSRNRPGDGLQGDSHAEMRLRFLDSAGMLLTGSVQRIADAATSTNYHRHVIVRPAPAGTARAELMIELEQQAMAPGSINVDSADLHTMANLTGAQGAGEILWEGALKPGVGEAVSVDDTWNTSADTDLEFFLGGPVAGAGHDQIVVGGTAGLGGQIRIALPNSASGQGSSLPYVPRPGQAFELVRAGVRTGEFSSVAAPAGLGGDAFALSYTSTGVWLQVVREIDSDQDGMPDYWENQFFQSPQGGNASIDSDLDGSHDGEEFIADTNPTNDLSYFALEQVTIASPVTIHFDSSTGRVYTLQCSDDLIAGAWSNVPGAIDQPGLGVGDNLSDPAITNLRSYRIHIRLP